MRPLQTQKPEQGFNFAERLVSNITFLFGYERHSRNELVWNHFHCISNDPDTEIAFKSALHLGDKKLETRKAFNVWALEALIVISMSIGMLHL